MSDLAEQRKMYEEVIKKLEEENRKLRSNIEFLHSWEWFSCMERINELEQENKKLNERIRFLEQCLDNKEKVNKSLREELEIWKLTAKDYAKLCWVDLDDK